jgi:hypothetical protein
MVGLNEGLRPDDPYNRHAHAPWWIVQSDDKKAAPTNCPHHLQSIPYERVRYDEPKLGKRQIRPDDYRWDMIARNVVPAVL